MQRLRRTIFVVICTGFGVAAPLPVNANDKLVELGQKLANKHCARCHVVNKKDRFGGISSTPSFSLLVNGLEDWEERFQSFHTRLPHPSIILFKGEKADPSAPFSSVPMDLEYSDIDALTAFVKTLKKN